MKYEETLARITQLSCSKNIKRITEEELPFVVHSVKVEASARDSLCDRMQDVMHARANFS